MQALRDIIGEGFLPNPYHDADMLVRYEEAGHDPAEVIYLSLGETWSEVAPGLTKALSDSVPAHSHGYMLTPYGLPALRRVLRSYITDTHHLAPVAEIGEDYEVAVSQNSTRNAMFNFGRLLLEDVEPQPTDHGRPIVVCSSPGWDYAGVFTALGYEIRTFALAPENHYQPVAGEVTEVLNQARRDTTGPVLLALNPQHNPTGANWDATTVRHLIRAALASDARILVDDAYYAVHDPEISPTCALRILLEEIGTLAHSARPRWLAVRSLGKQFHCNGWGIGAMTAAPDTVEAMLYRLLPQHTYTSSVPLQAAMAAWLEDEASATYLARQRMSYANKRTEVTKHLVDDLGYPDAAFFPGQCGAYLLMRVPPWYESRDAADESFRAYCLRRTGVLLGEAHMTTPGLSSRNSHGYLRLYLGPRSEILVEALERMAAAGLGWSGQPAEVDGVS